MSEQTALMKNPLGVFPYSLMKADKQGIKLVNMTINTINSFNVTLKCCNFCEYRTSGCSELHNYIF